MRKLIVNEIMLIPFKKLTDRHIDVHPTFGEEPN